MQQKVVYAGSVAASFASASELLADLADLAVPAKQVERLTRGVGTQRVEQRDAAVAAFQSLPLAERFDAPATARPPDLAVVFVDGGRLQIRERGEAAGASAAADAGPWEPEPVPEKGFWREDKVGLLAEMTSTPRGADPCPDVPPGFLDVLRIPVLARELGKVSAPVESDAGGPEPVGGAGEGSAAGAAYQPPEVTKRTVVGSCQPWPTFALVVAQAAWAAGLHKSKRKAFVADGAANNWRLRERFFGSFVAVLDFIHALSYVYAAATAGRPFEWGWGCYRKWISWVWKGEVARVIEELRQRQQEVGLPGEGEAETSVRSVVARALGYLTRHQDKMRYDEYRKEGLPITSSLMESVIKRMNQRVKGSEKFWCQEGAESIVQLRADHLSDGAPLDEFFQQRQDNATGQRRYRAA
ncbi:MAG TPA: hypothetical protein VKD72_32900 [Gemmataceae bacterium]|nr:hypothetical protein [Gemmataceae bacterium]